MQPAHIAPQAPDCEQSELRLRRRLLECRRRSLRGV